MAEFVQLLFNGLVTGSILAMAAVGVSLVYGVLRLVNFAAGDFMTLGAFIAVFLSVSEGWPLIAAVVVAIFAIAALGLGLDWLLWKRLRNSKAGTLALFLVATGVALILRQSILMIFSSGSRKFSINETATFSFLGANIATSQLIVLLLSSSAIVTLGLFMAKSTIGKDMRAFSDNASLAAVSGINVNKVVRYVWIINGILSALAGIFQGMVQGRFDSTMGWTLLLPIFAAVVLGTIGDAYGALLGGMTLGLVMELSTWHVLFGGIPSSYKPVVAFATLGIVLLVKPEGLLGVKARSI